MVYEIIKLINRHYDYFSGDFVLFIHLLSIFLYPLSEMGYWTK